MDRYSYTDIDDPKDYHRISWQYWQKDPEGEYVSLDDIQGSDYSGGSHTMANYHAVKEMFQDCQAMWDITGDYDSYGLMFHWPSLTDEEKQRLEEIEESLDKYPILDEQEWCEVEQEWIDEAWNNWLEWDVQRYLNRLFEQVFPGLLEFERNEICDA